MLDLLIRNGEVVTTVGINALDVGILNGTIAGLYAPGTAPAAKEEIDAGGLLVLPGVVDAHVHCRAPGHPEYEDFGSATRAAAAGGVTTMCEMPVSSPSVHNAAIVRARRELGEKECYVDFALWGAGGASEDDVLAMAEEGVCAFKVFLHAAPAGRESEFEGICVTDNYGLFNTLANTRQTGRYCALHAEENDYIRVLTDRLKAAGRNDPAAHGESRPPFVENTAVSKLLLLAEELEAPLYLPHTSTAGAVAMVREARARGVDVVLETCPQYLFFDESVMERVGPFGRINPPIRSSLEVDALWEALFDSTLDIVSSDHSPFALSDKEPYWQNIWAAPSGHPGLETLGPSLFSEAVAGRVPWSRVVDVLSERPARVLGFYPKKGAIVPGADADLLLFDPKVEWVVKREEMFTRARDIARLFDDYQMHGKIKRTLVRGTTVYDNGEIVGQAGHGRFVRPLD